MTKKITIQAENPSNNQEDPALVAVVDEMMAGSISHDAPEAKLAASDLATATPIDIFATTSAPLLTKAKLSQQLPAGQTADSDQSLAVDAVAELTPVNESEPPIEVTDPNRQPDNYDDAQTAQAIEEIVAMESDEVLMLEDLRLSQQPGVNLPPTHKTNHSHAIFWSLVAFVSLIAIGLAIFLINPTIHDPISKSTWTSIQHHL